MARKRPRRIEDEPLEVVEGEEDAGDPYDSGAGISDDELRAVGKGVEAEEAAERAAKRLPVRGEDGTWRQEEADKGQKGSAFFSLVWRDGERERARRGKLTPKARELEDKAAKERREEQLQQEAKAKKKEAEEKLKEEQSRPLNAAGRLLKRREDKLEIARLGESIMAEPEKGVGQSVGIGSGSPLASLLMLARDSEDKSTRKLAILSLVAVFKDIIPGYRIVTIENEKSSQLSKQVRKLRRFEACLLDLYQRFLGILNTTVLNGLGSADAVVDHRKGLAGDVRASSEVLAAMRGLCTMLVAKPNFNFRENLLAAIVPRMNSPVEEVRKLCCSSIATVLQDDVNGDATLQVVVYLSRFVRTHNHGLHGSVHTDMCEVLMHCDLKADLKDTKRLEEAKDKKRKRKRKRKEGDDIAAGMQEAESTVDTFHKHAQNAEALRELFVMYLRVLKRAPQSPLMPQVLRGVARYVHLINLEIAQALLSVLTTLVKSDVLSLSAGLQCVNTVALTLRGPGSELNVDESEFVAYMYRILQRLITSEPDRDEHVLVAIRCVESLFLGRKLYQHNRVASIVTRLSVLATFCSPHATLALVAAIRGLMTRYATVCRPLLDAEAEAGEGGNSLALGLPVPDSNVDPILAAQDATALWPLAQLQFHYHPHVRQHVRKALKMAHQLPSERPARLFKEYNPYREGGFNPAVKKTMTATLGKSRRRRRQNKTE